MNTMEMDPGCLGSIPFRKLDLQLQNRHNKEPAEAKCLATAILLRLWVDLTYEALATNSPGVLTNSGYLLHRSELGHMGLDWLWADGDQLVKLYTESGLLEVNGADYRCPMFVQQGMNAATRGQYVKREAMGGKISGFRRRASKIQADSQNIARELAPMGFYTDSEGNPLDSTQIGDAVGVIKQVDAILNRAARSDDTTDYPPGLVQEADTVVRLYCREQRLYRGKQKSLFDIACYYIIENQEEAGMPKTTEQVLPEIGKYVEAKVAGRSQSQEVLV